MTLLSENRIREAFTISMILKGINAVFEILGGFLFLSASRLSYMVRSLITPELIEDPHDLIANTIQSFLPKLISSHVFTSIYFLSHGAIKIFIVVALLKRKLWSYPTAIAIFSAFVAYQLYRYFNTHSFFLVVLSIFDAGVIYFTWYEYSNVKQRSGQ